MISILKTFVSSFFDFLTSLPDLLISFLGLLWNLVNVVVSTFQLGIKMLFYLGDLFDFISSSLQVFTTVYGLFPPQILMLVQLSLGVLFIRTVLNYLL